MLYSTLIMSFAENRGPTFSWYMSTILNGLIPRNEVSLPNFNEGYTIEQHIEV